MSYITVLAVYITSSEENKAGFMLPDGQLIVDNAIYSGASEYCKIHGDCLIKLAPDDIQATVNTNRRLANDNSN